MNTYEYIRVEIRVYNNKKNLVWIFGYGVLQPEPLCSGVLAEPPCSDVLPEPPRSGRIIESLENLFS